MKRVCKGQHELEPGHKFCPTCGKPGATPEAGDEADRDEQAATRGAATARMQRPEDEDEDELEDENENENEDENEDEKGKKEKQMPMTKAEIDAALQRLASLDGDEPTAEPVAKAADPADAVTYDDADDDIVTIDAHPMFEAVVESNGRLVEAQGTIAKAVRAAYEANEARFGALEGQLAEIKDLLVQTMQAPAAPRSRLAGVGVVQKSVTGVAPVTEDGPSWNTILVKARGAQSAGRLTADDISTLETWGHVGVRSLDAVRQHDPGFALKIAAAVAA